MSSDPFMSKVEQFLGGKGKEAEGQIEEVAKRLLKIDMVNPAIIQRVTKEVYGDFPLPPNFQQRLLAKLQELRALKTVP